MAPAGPTAAPTNGLLIVRICIFAAIVISVICCGAGCLYCLRKFGCAKSAKDYEEVEADSDESPTSRPLKDKSHKPVSAYAVGQSVEYYSAYNGQWIPAVVQGYSTGYYKLNIKEKADPTKIRLPAAADVETFILSPVPQADYSLPVLTVPPTTILPTTAEALRKPIRVDTTKQGGRAVAKEEHSKEESDGDE
jgi:hypothetical protein